MVPKKKVLISIVGATGIGKTALSIKLAKALSTEIISADSRQFYKELSIGTAVPTQSELNTVPHHFIQNKSIFDEFSVGDFEKEVLDKLDSLFEVHDQIIMVGGSGLYVDAVLNGLDKFPPVSDDIRNTLNSAFKKNGLGFLQEKLKTVDPEYYEVVDLNNPHRIIRALEIFEESGNTYSSYLTNTKISRSFRSLRLGLAAPRELIYARINDRVDIMMQQGLLEEVKKLIPYKNLNALQTVGYKELFACLEGLTSLEEAVNEIKKNTRRYAKRQGTWFKRNRDTKWFEHTTEVEEILNWVQKKAL